LTLDCFNGDRILVDIERAGCFTRSGTDAPRKLRKIVGRMQVARGFVPISAIDQIVPVRDLVVDGATGGRAGDAARAVAIRHATDHAARPPPANLFFWEGP